MGITFLSSDIVESGIQIEKNGKDFYEIVAASSKNDKAKQIFLYLAKEEEKHIKTFEVILSGIETYEPAESYAGEYLDYLKALSEEHVFTKEKKGIEIAQNVNTDMEAIDLAIGFEKDSILFYYEMKKILLEKDYKPVDKLIEQEQEHLRKLSEVKKSL